MRVISNEDSWSIVLTRKEEAEALLEAQASQVGNEAMCSTDATYDRIEPARHAVELLRFAELILPADDTDSDAEAVSFPLAESQHLSSLMFGALKRAKETGTSVTANDSLLESLNTQVDSFFGMDA